MYPSGYTQDTSQYIRIRILITNPPKLDNKPPLTPSPRISPSPLAGLLMAPLSVSSRGGSRPLNRGGQAAQPNPVIGLTSIHYEYTATTSFFTHHVISETDPPPPVVQER